MILLKSGERVIDIVKTAEVVSNGLKVTRLNDSQVIYAGGDSFTQTVIEEIPENVDSTRFSDYEYEGGVFTRVRFPVIKKSELLSRLTDDELGNIANYQAIISAQNITQNEKDLRISLMNKVMVKFNSYTELDLGHLDTTNFSQAIVGCGLITEERVQEILGL